MKDTKKDQMTSSKVGGIGHLKDGGKTISKGDWVLVHSVVLKPGERALNLPEDTSKVPLEMWVKGYALEEGVLGQTIEIMTKTGRKFKGHALEIEPTYKHHFGDFLKEVDQIDQILIQCLEEGE